MEALILLLGESLVVPLMIGVTGLIALIDVLIVGIGTAVDLALSVLGVTARSAKSARRPVRAEPARPTASAEKPAESPQAPRRPRIAWSKVTRWIGIAGGAILGLLLLAITIADVFLFEAIVRWQMAAFERKTAIAVTFESAGGSLWTGVVELHGARFERAKHESSQFDLSVETLRIDLSTTDLLFLRPVVETVDVSGVRGSYDRVGQSDRLKPRRAFRLGRLTIDDAVVQCSDYTRRQAALRAEVQIDSLVVEPLRSNWAVLDLLFRCNAAGSVNGHGFTVSTHEMPEGRQTRWQARELPIDLVAPYLGGPLNWLKAGAVDVDVTDRWRRGETTEIEMHWAFVLKDIKAEIPADASRTVRAVLSPAVAFLNKHPQRLPLEFDVVIDRERFRFAASADAAELGRAVGDAMAGELGRIAGVKPEAVKAAGAEAWAQFKDALDKRRKRRPQ